VSAGRDPLLFDGEDAVLSLVMLPAALALVMPNERAGGSPERPPEGGRSGEGDLVEEGVLMPG